MGRATKHLRHQYFSPESPGSFGGVKRLAQAVNTEVKYNDVEDWLKNQDTYTLFRQIKRKFPRLPILVNTIDEQWQIDLMDMTWLQKR